MEYDLCYFLMDFSDEEPIQMSSGGMIFNQMAERKSLKNPEKASEEKKNSQQELESAKKSSNVTENESRSPWPSFADEDYMVFSFRDDGGINLAEGKATAAADQGGRRDKGSPRRSSHKPEEKGSTDLPPDDDDIKEVTEVEETKKWKSVPKSSSGSTRSNSGSTRSNSSSSSFAFPVMNWEWKSSPQRMPKLEEQLKVRVPESKEQPRKAARRCARFHCCRF